MMHKDTKRTDILSRKSGHDGSELAKSRFGKS